MSTAEAMETTLPRRTLRKGTHSCAECKRRKIRCFFDRNSAEICVGCQQRGTVCIGQDLADVAVPREWESTERLKRVEQMLERITERLFDQNIGNNPVAPKIAAHFVARSSPSRSSRNAGDGDAQSDASADGTVDTTPDNTANTPISSTTSFGTRGRHLSEDQFALPKYAATCQTLHAAFPSQHDMDVLFKAGRASIYLQALCNPYHDLFTEKNTQSSATLSRIPSVTAHPVLLARKLLHLCLCISQLLDPSFDRRALRGVTDLRSAMQNYYELASSKVTCHDELLDSFEGVECLIDEAAFLTNCGSLRKALATVRRASTIAQFLGFHRKGSLAVSPKQLDRSTRISRESSWAHIAYLEKYISLLLGMPSAINCTRFGTKKHTMAQTEGEWFEKNQIDICEHVIRRNQERDYDFNTTLKIDGIINEIASAMPSSWWSPLDMQPGMGPNDMMASLINAQMQIIHYNMLTVLHLPFLLKNSSSENGFDYSRETCLYASREVLSRFIAFRSVMRVVYCCRPVDFCAFTAAMTLLLAYLNGVRSMQSSHQRIGDRALIERALETLEELTRVNNDELSRETARLTKKLLELEANSYNSGAYAIIADDQGSGKKPDWRSDFHVNIPYFGRVGVAPKHQTHSSIADTTSSLMHNSSQGTFSLQPIVQSTQPMCFLEPMRTENANMPLLVNQSSKMDQHDTSQELVDVPMPDVLASSDEWAFQGVDTAFFDAIFGSTGSDSNSLNWLDG